jgi:hypothetical protein
MEVGVKRYFCEDVRKEKVETQRAQSARDGARSPRQLRHVFAVAGLARRLRAARPKGRAFVNFVLPLSELRPMAVV